MENKSIKLYVVVSEWVCKSGENGVELSDIFTEKNSAKDFFESVVKSEKAMAEDHGYDCYEEGEVGNVIYLYEDGCYCENHLTIEIRELALSSSGYFEREVSNLYEYSCRMEDLLGELEQFDEGEAGVLYNLEPEKAKEIMEYHHAVERLDKALGNNDSYWDSYWNTVQCVLRDIRDAENERLKQGGIPHVNVLLDD